MSKIQKEQMTDTMHGVADYVATHAASQARTAGGWRRWLWAAAAAVAAAIAWFTMGDEQASPDLPENSPCAALAA